MLVPSSVALAAVVLQFGPNAMCMSRLLLIVTYDKGRYHTLKSGRGPGMATSLARVSKRVPLAAVPALYAPNPEAAKRFIEYFAAHIRNPNTRRAYLRAVRDFADWCDAAAVSRSSLDIEPVHIAAYIEQLGKHLAKPSVKQNLAAIRMLFDWLVVGQVVAANPAAPVRGPKHTVKKGKTPCSTADEARVLLDSISHGHDPGAPRPRLDRHHGLHVRPGGRGPQDAGRGRLRPGPAVLGPAGRERRQAARDALPPPA